MGPAPTKTSGTGEAVDIKGCLQYEIDLRMVEYSMLLPSSFASQLQKVIQEIESLYEAISPHPLEKYVANSLDTRFSRYNSVDAQAFNSQKSFMEVVKADAGGFETAEWFELGSRELFLGLLGSLQKHYEIEKKIKCEYDRQEGILQKGRQRRSGGEFETLRKSTLARESTSSKIDVGLLMRLYFEYYLRILKNNANSEQKGRVFEFHAKTGRMLCLLMVHGYLPMEELFELVYLIVYIEKHGVRAGKMEGIHRRYYPLALQKYYSIATTPHQLEVRQAAARLYLDELYLNSLREAEDPDIKPSEDSLLPIKVFPISRVKDKPKI